ncbi:MAG: type II toxin-antitoxin system Phd/YefM family antitoxin [Chloroflexi bacterium]|nr:type II toxin-antitoxin system Phd/YefM family antitoxin [Chloroflexota bacterium]
MVKLHPRYTTDVGGKQVVVLPRDEYERLLEELEIRDDIRAAQEAEAEGGTPIPLEQLLAEMDRSQPKRR